ncbi:hypothetical protein ASD04_14825 [Devosia sp. Root436]|uniref:helix-turn-helix domain-containing protein n=1 Tax=Devosia sp. Root436 TaxID=1736537 RepID=UPI0006FC0319|nr:helix-turn-helix transcriptional regulator [Devosia sp. Root436]KQX35312.1 hypothetical protein ASD04_14825 [Devosia sp. Root436]
MIRPFQIRAGRALLGWSAADLAKAAGISVSSITRAETADGPVPLKADSLVLVIRALRRAGVDFVKQGEKIGVVLDTSKVSS